MEDKMRCIIRELIKNQKLSMREVSEKTGLHQSLLWRWFNGEHSMTLRNFEKLCDAMEISIKVITPEITRCSKEYEL